MVFKHRDQSAWMWWRERDTHVLLHVRACGDSPVSLAMTHMRWLHGQRGHESTDNTQSVVQCVGGLRAWPIDRCSDKDAGKHERQTPIPCVETNRQKAEAKTKTTTEQHTTTHAALTTHRAGQDRAGQDRRRQQQFVSIIRTGVIVPRWNAPRQPRSDLRSHFEEVCGAPTVPHRQVCERAHSGPGFLCVCLPISQSIFVVWWTVLRGICQ